MNFKKISHEHQNFKVCGYLVNCGLKVHFCKKIVCVLREVRFYQGSSMTYQNLI